MSTSREGQLEADISLLREQLRIEKPPKRTDLIKVRFVGWEWWTPPPPIDKHPIQRKIKFAPDLVENQIYEVPLQDAGQKWFKRI